MEWITVVRRLDLGVSPMWPWPVALYPLWLGLFIFKVVLKRGQTSQGSLRIEWSKSIQSIVLAPGDAQKMIHTTEDHTGAAERDSAQPGTCQQTGQLKWQSLVCPQEKKKKGIFQYGALGEMRNGQHAVCRTWFGSCLISFFTVLSLHPLIPPTLPPTALS